MMSKALFIFRRDLRFNDNKGLIEAVNNSKELTTLFFFDPRQVTKENEYRSEKAISFMLQSLASLEKQIKTKGGKLHFIWNQPEKALKKIIKELNVDTVYINKDYTPFSIKRDAEIEKACRSAEAKLQVVEDLLLTNPDEIKTQTGSFYSVFTPFYKNVSKIKIPSPEKIGKIKPTSRKPSYANSLKEATSKINCKEKAAIEGGREAGLKILKNLNQFQNYSKTRDFPYIYTTQLSAHLKFGTISIREAFHAIKDEKNYDLLRQLYWRDFFTYVAYHNPKVFKGPYRDYDIKWSKSKTNFEKWCNGQTGFPIVDAGMRELNETGFMHNRVRMIASSFLMKDLHINWQLGEKYFAQKLVDYDPCVNNGNWQWAASTGTDAVPYFRIFNPWTQQKRFDKDAEYIKKWVPELKDLSSKEIHSWFKEQEAGIDYPKPMVDHDEERKVTLQMYRN